MAFSGKSVPWRVMLKWSLLLLPFLGLGWGLHALLPPEPRWSLPEDKVQLCALLADGSAVLGVANLPDERHGDTQSLCLIDLRTSETLSGRFADTRPASTVALSGDGRRLAAIFPADEELRVFDLQTGLSYQVPLERDKQQPESPLLFSPDGSILAVNTTRRQVLLVEAKTGKLLDSLEEACGSTDTAFTPDGTFFLCPAQSAGPDYRIHVQVWDTRKRRWVFRLEDTHDIVQVSPDGQTLIGTRFDEEPKEREWFVWDLAGQRRRRIRPANRNPGLGWAFSANSRVLACWDLGVETGGHAEFWDLREERRLGRVEFTGLTSAEKIRLSPDGRTFTATSIIGEDDPVESGAVNAWDVDSGRLLWQRRGPVWTLWNSGGLFYQPQFSPDSRHLLLPADAPHRLEFLDARTGELESLIPLATGEYRIPSTQQSLTPQGRHYLLHESLMDYESRSPLLEWLRSWLPGQPSNQPAFVEVLLVVDSTTGRETGRLNRQAISGACWLSADGKTVLTQTQNSEGEKLDCWDVPPRKPLRWIVAPPLVLAGVFLGLRRWRKRLSTKAKRKVEAEGTTAEVGSSSQTPG